MTRRLVTVFGGSGFIGRHLVQRLAADGWLVRVAVRDPVAAGFLQPLGDVAQINAVAADVTDSNSVAAAVRGADAVVNLVGILYERGRRSFDRIHRQGAENVARVAREAGAARLVHVSALGADRNSASAYARSKAAGEEAVQANFPGAVIFRPSVVFGPEDGFFNRFARMAAWSPFLPVITGDGFRLRRTESGFAFDLYGSGGPIFQPVYVGDVAEALRRAVNDPQYAGKVFELGGPGRYSMKEVMELVMRLTGHRRPLLPLPFWAARIEAAFLQYLPTPLLTPDQVALMRVDNVVRGGKPGLAELGVLPTTVEAVVPSYLSRKPLPLP